MTACDLNLSAADGPGCSKPESGGVILVAGMRGAFRHEMLEEAVLWVESVLKLAHNLGVAVWAEESPAEEQVAEEGVNSRDLRVGDGRSSRQAILI